MRKGVKTMMGIRDDEVYSVCLASVNDEDVACGVMAG